MSAKSLDIFIFFLTALVMFVYAWLYAEVVCGRG